MSKIIDDIKLEYRIGGIVNKLIYWNIGIFLLSLYFYEFRIGEFLFPNWLALNSDFEIAICNIWTLISYAFLHHDFWHLFFNMMVLNFSGRLFLIFFTEKQFFGLYILSAIFAGICFTIGFYFLNYNSQIVGASGSIMAILFATTTYQPLMNIRLLLIGNVKLWHLTAVIILLDILDVLIINTGGHIAHLAGAFFGFIYIELLQKGYDLSKIVTNSVNFFVKMFQNKNKKPFKKIQPNYNKTKEKPVIDSKFKSKTQQQIDEILDKISKSGYDSLSAEEKEFLFKAGK